MRDLRAIQHVSCPLFSREKNLRGVKTYRDLNDMLIKAIHVRGFV